MNWQTTAADMPGYMAEWHNLAMAHLRLTTSDAQDTVLCAALQAAIDYAEDRTTSAIVRRSITARYYADERLLLPRGPVIEISSATDGNGAALADDVDWSLRYTGHQAELVALRRFVYPVTVNYLAGYESIEDIPAGIRLGILVHAATLYAHRESVSDKPLTPVPHSLDDFYSLKRRSAGVG